MHSNSGGQPEFELLGQITALIDFSLCSLRMNALPLETIKRLQHTINCKFHQQQYASHAFVIGLTNHWISIVAHKHEEHLEIFVLDSCNVPVISASDYAINDFADKLQQRRMEQVKSGFVKDHEFYRSSYLRELDIVSMQSTKFLTWLIHDAILQKVDILRALIELNIHGFVESFFSTMGHENYIRQKSVKTYFSSILKSSYSGVTAGRSAVHLSDGLDRLRAVEALVEWLERYFPPAGKTVALGIALQ